MDIQKFLEEITRLPGVPGYEAGVNGYVKSAFEPLCDEVSIDRMENVIARQGKGGPRVMISAHQDEVGMMVLKIEDDGSLRITPNGGVDSRILPSMEVTVVTRDGAMFGVIGAKPPHILTEEEKKQTLKIADLYVDTGFDAQTVKARVRIGDPVVMRGKTQMLMDGRMVSKTMDDRASIAAMLVCAETMKHMNAPAEVCFVSSTQEEIGSKGAMTAAYALDPDFAIAIDVTHAEGPGTGKYQAVPIDKPLLTVSPYVNPVLLRELRATADKWHIPYTLSARPSRTATDLDHIFNQCAGIPAVLVSIPLRYMHTTVETLQTSVIEDAGRMMALFIDEISRKWGDIKWF